MPEDHIYQADPSHLAGDAVRDHHQHRRNDSNGRPRTATVPAEVDETLSHPGSVRINVEGAFIVDQDSATPTSPNGRSGSPGHHDTKDIRLPNHTAVVSHIAVDVRTRPTLASPAMMSCNSRAEVG